jgi:hypothetical protein
LQVLSKEETIKQLSWSDQFPDRNHDYARCDGEDLFFTHPEASCIDLEYPPKLERLPYFARLLAAIGYEDQDFGGALLWFTGWGVWNLRDEAMGYRIVEAMHRAAGQPKSFETAPGHRFRGDELQDAVAMLMQPMVFGFDAYYLPQWSYGTGEFFLYVSHDSFVSVVTRTREFYERAFSMLRELNLNPKPGNELRLRRFCRIPTGTADGGAQ